jgi:hypothetical protein
VPALTPLSTSGVSRLLKRLKIALKRGRDYVHSPDPDYLPKLAFLRERLGEALRGEGRTVLVFGDEMSYYRQPSLSRAYEAQGKDQPLARRSYHSNTQTRVVAALNPLTGQVTWRQGAKCGLAELVRFFEQLRAAYPHAERIDLVLDNWPVHFHPDVRVALEPQTFRFGLHLPKHWPTTPSTTAQRKWGEKRLPIHLVQLPTYAPWTNPIEKLWRWVRQAVGHLHPWADRLEELREAVGRCLDQFAVGSTELLQYVGLSDPEALYATAPL